MEITRIICIGHSGFLVELPEYNLIFDYFTDKNNIITPEIFKNKNTCVFASHSHYDHYNKKIFDWNGWGDIIYILDSGCAATDSPDIIKMREGDEVMLPGGQVSVKAYGSTDEGVSFLVRVENNTVFHAGDLNLWHWREVSTLREIEQAEHDFHSVVKPLQDKEIDLAFFPVDPRQGSLYDAGANYFVMAVKPRVLIPMHWQDRVDVAQEYVRKNRTRRVEMVALTRPGETVVIGKSAEKPEDTPQWYYQMIQRDPSDDQQGTLSGGNDS